jgi:hypothetical protein
MRLPFFYIGPDQIFPQYLDISSRTDVGDRQSMRVFCCQLCVVELLSGRLCNVAIDGGVSGCLLCTICLYHLARNFFLTTKNGGGRSVLPIDNGEVASFNRGDNDGSEFRPIEILGNLVDVCRATSADFTLIRYIDNKLVGLYPFQKGCGSGRELRCRRTEPLRDAVLIAPVSM